MLVIDRMENTMIARLVPATTVKIFGRLAVD